MHDNWQSLLYLTHFFSNLLRQIRLSPASLCSPMGCQRVEASWGLAKYRSSKTKVSLPGGIQRRPGEPDLTGTAFRQAFEDLQRRQTRSPNPSLQKTELHRKQRRSRGTSPRAGVTKASCSFLSVIMWFLTARYVRCRADNIIGAIVGRRCQAFVLCCLDCKCA